MAHLRATPFIIALLMALLSGMPASRAQDADPKTAEALFQSGLKLYQANKYADAEPLFKDHLAALEATLSPADPKLANGLIYLARTYVNLARYAEAEPLYQRALPLKEKTLGPDHREVGDVLNRLGVVQYRLGRYDLAEPLCQRALEIRERTLGLNHLEVAESLINLGRARMELARYRDAEPLIRRGLAIREKLLQPGHSSISSAIDTIGDLYFRMGKFRLSEDHYLRNLEIYQNKSETNTIQYARTISALALIYDRQAKNSEADKKYNESLSIQEEILGKDSIGLVGILGSYGEFLRSQGKYDEAKSLLNRALRITEVKFGENHKSSTTVLHYLGLLNSDRSLNREGEVYFRRSLALREKEYGLNHPYVAVTLSSISGIYRTQGRYAEAAALLERAVDIFERTLGPDHTNLAWSLQSLGNAYRALGRDADSEKLQIRSMAIREKEYGPEHPEISYNLASLALIYARQTRNDEAEIFFKRSLTILENSLGPDNAMTASAMYELANFYSSQNRYELAETLYKRGISVYEAAYGPHTLRVAQGLNGVAAIAQANGALAQGRAASRRAIDIVSQNIQRASDANFSTGRQYAQYFRRDISLAYEIGEAEPERRNALQAEAFETAQGAQSTRVGGAVAGMAARFASGGDALAAVVRERQDLGERFQTMDSALLRVLGKAQNERDLDLEAKLRNEQTKTNAAIAQLDQRIAAEFPAYAELNNPKPLSVSAAQALLAPDEALLVYVTGIKDTWLWAVRRDRMSMHRIEIGADALAGEVSALRGRLDPALNPRLAPFPAIRAYDLHQKILAPAAPLLEGARQVFIVPDGALESLPIGVLVTQPPKEDPFDPADHRDIAWFARDHAVSVLPSVGSLRALRQFTSATRAASPYLGIGDPSLEGRAGTMRGVEVASLFRGAVVDVDAVRKLDPLPETAGELRAVARSMGAGEADLLLGARATEPTLRAQKLDQFRVLHFATHGLTSGELRGLAEPALVLTPPTVGSDEDDGLLTASKIAQLKLNADWVVLSACNTAASDGTPNAGGMSGLTKAFFYAGARSLLVSHWAVPSQATVGLVTGAFDALGKEPSIGRAEALRRAQLAMLSPASPPEFAHPMAWAAFVLAGEGGAAR